MGFPSSVNEEESFIKKCKGGAVIHRRGVEREDEEDGDDAAVEGNRMETNLSGAP